MASGQSQNYLKTTTYKIKTNTPIQSPEVIQADQNIVYYDGLGRPIQERDVKHSNTGKDIVKHVEYDNMGREAKEFLPYVSQTSTIQYESNANSELLAFYGSPTVTRTGNPNFEATSNPYSEKIFESSPLERVIKEGAPGNSWGINSGHEIKTEYTANINSDQIIYFQATVGAMTNGFYPTTLSQQGYFNQGELNKVIIKDENWTSGNSHTTQEFTNKKGQLILKRVFGYSLVNGTSVETSHDTYYVYDTFGNLCFVLPPLSDKSGGAQDIQGICYQYRYDHRNRMVEKKLPGKDWEFIIYDNLDRIIANGPVLPPFSNFNASNTGWLFTKYDVYGRVAYTGWMPATINSAERYNIQSSMNSQITNLNETKIVTATNTNVNGVVFRYTNQAWPTSGNCHILSVNYYDDYNFPNAPTSFSNIAEQTAAYNLTVKPKGMKTGTWKRLLETSSLVRGETSYTLYDYKSRPIRTSVINYLGGSTETDLNLDFTGKTIYKVTRHKRTASAAEVVITENFSYSPQGRLLTHTHQINSNPIELLVKNEYDELGQQISKKVGGSDLTGASPLQKVDFSYNIRGWLKEINNINSLNQTGYPTDLFSFKINYNVPETAVALFNGNISETYWRTSSDNKLRKYVFSYDSMNRMTNAVYQKPDGLPVPNSYGESLSYDKNGNIQKLERYGELDDPITALKIDELEYVYDNANKNRLLQVTDSTINPNGFNDGNTSNSDYSYDLFGNATSDLNKGITSITYNHQNLPTKVVFGSELWKIEFVYDADGRKILKKVPYVNLNSSEGVSYSTIEYLEEFHYQANVLKFFPTAEGYVEKTGNFYSYIYNYTDHLGNVRLSYARDPESPENLKIIEENHYYPFGLKHAKYNTEQLVFKEFEQKLALKAAPTNPAPVFIYNYKFQGQERQNDKELNWDSFKWRNYDYAIGRFLNIDPLAMDFTYNSPYAFTENKIGMGRELEGCEIGPLVNFAFGKTPPMLTAPEVVRVGAEIGGKASETSGRFTEAQLDNFARGSATEAEQLLKNGLEKNTKPYEVVDPKTGKPGVTIPDAVKPGGGTVEIKNVGKQSLTKQLRLQKALSESNGAKPELIINKGAKITKPLQNGGFDIKTYSTNTGTAIDNTSVSKPKPPKKTTPSKKAKKQSSIEIIEVDKEIV